MATGADERMEAAPTIGASDRIARFLSYFASLELSEYDHTHRIRLIETLRRMDDVIRPGMAVIELGGLSRLAQFLAVDSSIDLQEYTKDLRFPLDLPDASFDLVLMLEVLEHLNDRHTLESPIAEIAMFTGSGAISCMQEIYRILKPGGHLVLTTPNATSVDTLGRVLLKEHPFQYKPHVREYAPGDVVQMITEAGLETASTSTFFAWNALPKINREELVRTIMSLGYEGSDRGDDLFVLAGKAS